MVFDIAGPVSKAENKISAEKTSKNGSLPGMVDLCEVNI